MRLFGSEQVWLCVYGGPPLAAPLPGVPSLLLQLFACMWIDDTYFYWSHRLFHHKLLYKHVHKKHHRFHHPVGICTEYCHPVEDLLVNAAGTVAGPLLLGSHAAVMAAYLGLKLLQSIDAHSGFDLPFSPFSVLRSMDCAPAHDFHRKSTLSSFVPKTWSRTHSVYFPFCFGVECKRRVTWLSLLVGFDLLYQLFADSHNTGMYGGWFLFWDWICGTDQTYLKHLGKNDERLGFRRAIWRLQGSVDRKEA